MKIIHFPEDGYASNSYLLVSGGEAAAVDPSIDAETLISAAGENGAEIRLIILTHGHFDHMLSLDDLRDKTGAPVLIGAGDGGFLTDPKLNLFCQALGQNTAFAPAERLLSDGDEIKLGEEKLTVLSTPGHTPGSCCFTFDGGLITGDTLFHMSVGRCDLPGGDGKELKASIERLKTLPLDFTIYPGHGPISTLEKQTNLNPFMNGEI